MKKILVLLVICACGQFVFGQSDIQTQSGRRNARTLEEIKRDNLGKRMGDMSRISNARREISLSGNKKLSGKERKRIENIAKVDEEIKNKYKSFLKKSNTGIFRLLPDFECETKNVIRLDGDCKIFVPGLWTYSFRSEDYSDRNIYDITFKGDELTTGSLLSQGILVSLGDKSLDSILLSSAGLSFLTDFKPATEFEAINKQYREISEGIEQNGFTFSNTQQMKVNTTYALRVIAYKYKDKWKSRMNEKNVFQATDVERRFHILNFDERNDSIYIFRIVDKSADGGVAILWKRLTKEESPKIIFEKNEKLRDFKF